MAPLPVENTTLFSPWNMNDQPNAPLPRQFQFPPLDSVALTQHLISASHSPAGHSKDPDSCTRHRTSPSIAHHVSLAPFTWIYALYSLCARCDQLHSIVYFSYHLRVTRICTFSRFSTWPIRRHPATRTFGDTSGRTTLVQLSSHEFHAHPSSSPFDWLVGSTTRLNEARNFSNSRAFGKPSRRFCTADISNPRLTYIDVRGNIAEQNVPRVDRQAQRHPEISRRFCLL
jgi:hypothetical protein